ncbi:hypothetical protein BH23CHL5_BH23CHL5_03820 [soil metagenome]
MSINDGAFQLSEEDLEFLVALLRSSAVPLTTAQLIESLRGRVR